MKTSLNTNSRFKSQNLALAENITVSNLGMSDLGL
jgi:hypothetical protein